MGRQLSLLSRRWHPPRYQPGTAHSRLAALSSATIRTRRSLERGSSRPQPGVRVAKGRIGSGSSETCARAAAGAVHAAPTLDSRPLGCQAAVEQVNTARGAGVGAAARDERSRTLPGPRPVPDRGRPPRNRYAAAKKGSRCRSASRCGSLAGWPSPTGIGRRPRPSSAVRQVLVAIRYIQVRTEDRCSNRSNDRHARR